MNTKKIEITETDYYYDYYVYKPKTYEEIVQVLGATKVNGVYLLSNSEKEVTKLRLAKELEKGDLSLNAFTKYKNSIHNNGATFAISKFTIENSTKSEMSAPIDIKKTLSVGKIVTSAKNSTIPPSFKRALLFTSGGKSYIVSQPNLTYECNYAKDWCEENGLNFNIIDGWAAPGYKAYEISLK